MAAKKKSAKKKVVQAKKKKTVKKKVAGKKVEAPKSVEPEKIETKASVVTKKVVADMLRVSERTITDYQNNTDDPLPIFRDGKRGESNYYSLPDVLDWAIRRYLKQLGITDEDDKPVDFMVERARLTKLQADGQELKNKLVNGSLAPVKILEFSLMIVCEQVSSLLETIPLKVKNQCPSMRSSEIEIIKRIIVKAQNAARKSELDFDRLEELIKDLNK